jgi:hypothetical protein
MNLYRIKTKPRQEQFAVIGLQKSPNKRKRRTAGLNHGKLKSHVWPKKRFELRMHGKLKKDV